MRQKIVVIGAGFAGLELVSGLKGTDCDITLIDRRNHHLFQPLLYQVATTVLSTAEVAWPVRRLFRKRKDVTTLMADVTDIDRMRKKVICADGTKVDYDWLAVATGAGHTYFGHDEWERFAPGLKTLEDATTIRRHLLQAFEKAELTSDDAERQALLTFVIIGAGPTGVELAGSIAELCHRVLPSDFRRIDTRATRIILVEAGDRILAGFDPKLSEYAASALQRRGVQVRTGAQVTDITAEGVRIGDAFLQSRTVLWAAGVRASPAAEWLGAETDRAGRAKVSETLQLPDDPSVFVLGDTAHIVSAGSMVPGVAPAAKQQGAYAARVIRAALRGKPAPPPFRYRHQGDLATIGRNAAIIDLGRLTLSGRLAWWVWGISHIYFLIGTRSRIFVALSWLWSFLTRQNSGRLITQSDKVVPRNDRQS